MLHCMALRGWKSVLLLSPGRSIPNEPTTGAYISMWYTVCVVLPCYPYSRYDGTATDSSSNYHNTGA
jgi:hypothetical protein